MTRVLPRLAVAGLVASLSACGNVRTVPEGVDGMGGSPDGAGSGSGMASPTCEPAEGPFGTEVGQSFPDIELTACDGSKVSLDELRCENSLTFVSVGAGWCEPCMEEAPELQATAEAFADEGVEVVQVMYQDAEGKPATTVFCQTWTDTFGLTIPVLVDPVGNTLNFFEQAQTPLNFVVDGEGQVVWAMTGKPDDVQAVVASLLP